MQSVPSMSTHQTQDWCDKAQQLAETFALTAMENDQQDKFVAENYAALKRDGFMSAMIPASLGGGQASYTEMCTVLRTLAKGCSSTALALSMHSHLVATNLWKLKQGHAVQGLLQRISAEQLVLVSTGASDWLHSSGRAEKVAGGFRVNALKVFASGCPVGDVLVTSACFDDPEKGPSVIHFPVPFSDPGIVIMDTWQTMGMRSTASNDIQLNDVFVPVEKVVMQRPQGLWHPFYNVVCAMAAPLIMSVYLGIAEAAATLVVDRVKYKKHDPHLPYLLGEMQTSLTACQLAVTDMIRLVNEFDFLPSDNLASDILQRKTIAAEAALRCVEKAMETLGGSSFFRSIGLEKLLRDMHGAQFHPLPEKRQQHFTGSVMLGLVPKG
ncbi:acyl-CoA/acyl-ACP dehydrogenase [Bowmanella sp. Y26]|uniref:acyl-CoA dehydrogenase family protein n=1 Tax=Bowmanella yangjiangensis TaxID=2811230 RepID=UPI001BDD0846|nr:acyl-CoA dehydrogenase family protein [Bowmanella yangjiangensis]MBT1064017.1 acyl-CoA/acyl-ACP dehydrogenase [Bowmanella yangjiangensis]